MNDHASATRPSRRNHSHEPERIPLLSNTTNQQQQHESNSNNGHHHHHYYYDNNDTQIRMHDTQRNSSSGTLVTSNRSNDSLKQTLYHQPSTTTTTIVRGGNFAIGISVICLLLCGGVLLSFLSRIILHSTYHDPFVPWGNASTTNTTQHSILQQQLLYRQQYYDTNGRYIQEDYDISPSSTTSTTSIPHSILSGLVGIYGIPLYAYYTTRGQCMTRMGYQSIHSDPILADTVSSSSSSSSPPITTTATGFRTFVQITHRQPFAEFQNQNQYNPLRFLHRLLSWWSHPNDDMLSNHNNNYDEDTRMATTHWMEPFSPLTSRFRTFPTNPQEEQERSLVNTLLPKRYMYIGWNMIQIQEINVVEQIETNVTFFILPEEDFGAFVKHTTITNLESSSSFQLLSQLSSSSSSSQRTAMSRSRRRKGTDSVITLSILDGLTRILPAVGENEHPNVDSSSTGIRKPTTTTSILKWEDYMMVDSPYSSHDNNDSDDDDNFNQTTIEMPFYRLSLVSIEGNTNAYATTTSTPEVGHWCISILGSSSHDDNDDDDVPRLLPILYNPSIIFGEDTTLVRPVRLQQYRISDLLDGTTTIGGGSYHSKRGGFVPSAFAAVTDVTLRPGQSTTITSFYGTAQHKLDVPVIARRLLQPGFVQFKLTRANELGQQVTSIIESRTANPLWDGHVQQMLLDNSLLGGIPQIVGEDNDDSKLRCTDEDGRLKVLHLFSHIHGDIGERDYSSVEIAPTFFSNGPGNFRDVVQSRRNDVFFNPRIGSFNVKTFLSFIQADGYEPLKVESLLFKIDNIDDCVDIATQAVGEADGHRAQRTALTNILHSGMFRPGQLFLDMMQQNIELVISRQEFIDIVTAVARPFPKASFASGFWADHWTYYMDVIDTYLSIYPDWEKRIFFEEQLLYFSSPAIVKPRSEKYVLLETNSDKKYHVRQLNCTAVDESEQRQQYSNNQYSANKDWSVYKLNWQHDEDGVIFRSTTMEKLFLLVTVKFAARDPYGIGILYESGKTGWNDANYGLANLIGSGTPELYELYVLMKFVKTTIKKYEVDINIPIELYRLVMSINAALDLLQDSGYVDGANVYPKVPQPLFNYWDTVTTSLEVYRKQVEHTFIGTTHPLPCDYLDNFMKQWMTQIEFGKERGRRLGTHGYGDDGNSGVPPTYFFYDVVSWTLTGESSIDGHALVMPLEMEVHSLPLYLEGPTRMLKTVSSREEAKRIYEAVHTSPLRDTNLPMYTISASLKGQSPEIGRASALPPGWLENQSISLHMSYKYYLELLRHGLYQEFFTEIESGGMLPFFDPKVYGQSLMVSTTFVVSSAYDDPSMHGRGYSSNDQLQYSGTTSEFLSMWIYIMIGSHPFSLHHSTGQLQMQLLPTIPVTWFYIGQDGNTLMVQYKLFGSIDVRYYNTQQVDLYDILPTRYVVTLRDGTIIQVDGPIIDDSDLADKIRRVVFVATLDVYF